MSTQPALLKLIWKYFYIFSASFYLFLQEHKDAAAVNCQDSKNTSLQSFWRKQAMLGWGGVGVGAWLPDSENLGPDTSMVLCISPRNDLIALMTQVHKPGRIFQQGKGPVNWRMTELPW